MPQASCGDMKGLGHFQLYSRPLCFTGDFYEYRSSLLGRVWPVLIAYFQCLYICRYLFLYRMQRDGKAEHRGGHPKLLRVFARELLCFDRTCFVCACYF